MDKLQEYNYLINNATSAYDKALYLQQRSKFIETINRKFKQDNLPYALLDVTKKRKKNIKFNTEKNG